MRISIARNQTRGLLRIAVATLVAGIVANTACSNDVTGPRIAAGTSEPLFTVFPAQDLVPNTDYFNDVEEPMEPYHRLWECLDDPLPTEDECYIFRNRMGLPPTVSTVIVELTDPATAPDPGQTHTLKLKFMVWGSRGAQSYSTTYPQPTSLQYELLNGFDVIAYKTVFPVGQDWVIDSVGVNPSLITDYTQLKIRFNLTLKPATNGLDQIQGRVAWARLEIR